MNFGLPVIDYLVIGIYLVLMLGIGFYFSRFMKGGKDFFVGGNLIPWWVAGVSLYMTMFSAWTFTGAASFVYNTGWFGLLYFATWPIAFFISFQISAQKWRRTRITSPVEYVQTRFNKTTHLFLSTIFALNMLYWPAHHLASLCKICAPTLFPGSMLAIDMMIVVIGIIVLIYTYTGGFWAVCVTDVVQFLLLISICIVLLPTIFLGGEMGSVAEFFRRIPPLKLQHVLPDRTLFDHWYLLGLIAANIFGYAIGEKAQRFYSVKDEREAKRVGWLTFSLFMTVPILFGIPPLVGKVLWPDINMLHYFSQITKPDENIFIAVVLRYMPVGVIGIFLSAMMAASMSSMNAVWNTAASIISIDLYKNLIKPQASEKEVLLIGRLTVFIFALIAIMLALVIIHSHYGVFSFTNIFFGLTSVPIAIPLLLGIMSKNISRWSAMASILVGALTASVAKFLLHYSLGQQFLITVFVTLLFIFISRPLGRLYNQRRIYVFTISSLMGALFWCYFLSANNNVNLSFGSLPGTITSGGMAFFSSAHFGAILTSSIVFILTYKFSALFARDLRASQDEVIKFFKLIEIPIDVDREIYSRGAKETNIFPLVGGISIGLSIISLVVLIVPSARTKYTVNLAISGLLLGIGLWMVLVRTKRRAVAEYKFKQDPHRQQTGRY